MSELAALIERIDARFRSANSVPVERAPIKADEWAAIRAELTTLKEPPHGT